MATRCVSETTPADGRDGVERAVAVRHEDEVGAGQVLEATVEFDGGLDVDARGTVDGRAKGRLFRGTTPPKAHPLELPISYRHVRD